MNTLPATFQFTANGYNYVAKSEKPLQGYSITDNIGEYIASYSTLSVEKYVAEGHWTILKCENSSECCDYACGETSNTLFDNGQPPIASEFILQEAECADKYLYNRRGKSVTLPNVNSKEYLKAQSKLRDKLIAEEPLEMVFDECCEDISLLDYIKDFTTMTGASVTIMDGTYLVHQGNDEYIAECDCGLTEVCDAITTLHMARTN